MYNMPRSDVPSRPYRSVAEKKEGRKEGRKEGNVIIVYQHINETSHPAQSIINRGHFETIFALRYTFSNCRTHTHTYTHTQNLKA
jgi:hypothetical protein